MVLLPVVLASMPLPLLLFHCCATLCLLFAARGPAVDPPLAWCGLVPDTRSSWCRGPYFRFVLSMGACPWWPIRVAPP